MALLSAIVAAGLGLALIRPIGANDYLARGDDYANQYAFEAAIASYQRARELTPHDPTIALRLARVHRARRDFDQAALELTTALAFPATRPVALIEAGDLAQQRGDPAIPRERWHEAAIAAPADPTPLSRLAGSAVQQRDFVEARRLLDQLLALTPHDAPALYQQAVLVALTDRDWARRYLAALDPAAPALLRERATSLGRALDQADQADQAGRPAEAALWLGQAYLEAGELGPSQAAFEQALARDPHLVAARSRLAYVLTQTGDYSRAARTGEEAIAASPDDPLAWEALGAARRGLGDLAGARQTFEQAAERFPDDPLFQAELGNLLVASGEPLLAEERFNRAVELAPGEPTFLVLKAHFYLDRGWQVMRGLEAAWRAEELRPEDAEIKDLVGWGHYLLRDSQVAADKLAQAIRLDPTLASAHYHLAVVYEANQRADEARAEYEKARDLARDRATREAAQIGLDKVRRES